MSRHAPTAVSPGMNRLPLYRRLGGPQGRSGRVGEISPTVGFDPQNVRPVASSYTDKLSVLNLVIRHQIGLASSLRWIGQILSKECLQKIVV